MSSQNARLESGGFVPFYRSYTKTWIHAVATAGLTAFGTLTIVHRWFAALALASYVVPPIVLYLRHGRADDRAAPERDEAAPEPSGSDSDPGAESERAPSEAERTVPDRPATESKSEPATSEPRPEPSPEPVERNETSGREEPEPTEPSAATELEEPERREWHAVATPTEATLHDVVVTGADDDANGAYAVGDGGIVLAGPAEGDTGSDDTSGEWSTVLEDGPAAGGNALRGVDATADGAAVWIAGDSGALGRIDAETGRHTDYTAPQDVTDNWLGVAVGGASGAETVLLINGSGAVLRGEYRATDAGQNGDRTLEWTGPEKPGSGSSFSGIALATDAVGYCCDTNDGVYETTDGGESFARVGLEGADGMLTDVATGGLEDCLVSADDGVVHRYDGPTWTPERVADGALHGVARRGDRAAASAADGAVHERSGAAADWERTDTGTDAELLAVSLGDRRAVAVGEDGTVVVRG